MESLATIYNECNVYINYILIAISIISSIIAIIKTIKANFTESISKFIKLAEEDKNLSGIEKMDMVICWVKQLIPKIFRIVFNDKVLKQISQNIYDDMKGYKEVYIKNKTGLSTKEVVEVVNLIKDDPESPITK